MCCTNCWLGYLPTLSYPYFSVIIFFNLSLQYNFSRWGVGLYYWVSWFMQHEFKNYFVLYIIGPSISNRLNQFINFCSNYKGAVHKITSRPDGREGRGGNYLWLSVTLGSVVSLSSVTRRAKGWGVGKWQKKSRHVICEWPQMPKSKFVLLSELLVRPNEGSCTVIPFKISYCQELLYSLEADNYIGWKALMCAETIYF